MNSRPEFSIIICSHLPHRAAVAQAHFRQLFADYEFEIIMIPDAVSLCEGYNRGFAMSSGKFIIFSHDDIEFVDPTLPQRLAAHFENVDVIGVAGTTRLINGAWVSAGDPHAFALFAYPDAEGGRVLVKACGRGGVLVSDVQALDGCFMAANRAAVELIGFDADTFDGFHLYDLDFSYRAHLCGLKVAVCRDLVPIHASTGKPDQHWQKYRERLEAKFAATFAPELGIAQHSPTRVVQVLLQRTALAAFIADGGPQRMIAAL